MLCLFRGIRVSRQQAVPLCRRILSLPAAASAVTITESLFFIIHHDKLNGILEKHDRIGRIVYKNLLAVLVERLRASNAELDLFRA